MDTTKPNAKQLESVSRTLSKILRHEPQLVGVTLDNQGWIDLVELIDAIERTARVPGASKSFRSLPTITVELIQAVVAANDKQRFSLSEDGIRIRAAQGHSVEVDLGYVSKTPPAVLYHGTAVGNWVHIQVEGLKPGSRHAVHLSAETETARRVGARHGTPIVLIVDAAQMHADGSTFTQSDNGVWLTEHVPARYLTVLAA
ncbi:putative RNA 2'-phosphotransferase [Paraburkholderia tropica]|uniref:RNA 2'-phosphotransferase n=1 Tax=Paraburkholderia tropica TaxID=92647 RepID=UPI001CB257A4|nr:RNA 2'-phosphotransferase [Paraburkholderia tropica]CAG9234334.1 putative RNA 2'-phosphotransferase [Paraburkholderia tropica]